MKFSVLTPLEISDLDEMINGQPQPCNNVPKPGKGKKGLIAAIVILSGALLVFAAAYFEKRKKLKDFQKKKKEEDLAQEPLKGNTEAET
jgi:hypothetical protein